MLNQTLPQKLFPFIFFFVKRYKYYVSGMSLIMIFWAVDVSLRPYLIKLILDSLEIAPNHKILEYIWLPATLYLAVSLFMVLILRVYNYLDLNVTPSIRKDIIYKLTNDLLGYSHTYFQNKFSGTISNKIIYIAEGTYKILNLFIERFFSMAIALSVAIVAFYSVDIKISLVVISWVMVYLSITLLSVKKILSLSKDLAQSETQNTGHIVDLLSNSSSVRFFARYVYESELLNKILNVTVAKDKKMLWYTLLVYLFQGLSYIVMLVVTMYILIEQREKGLVTIGDFGLVLSLELSIIELLWEISKDFSEFAMYLGEIEQGLDLVTNSDKIQEVENAKSLNITKGDIKINNIKFHYKEAKPLFDDFSLHIPGGQKVGLVGYSGSGKTTFINLIIRLFETQAGSITIDGQNIQEVSKNSLREQLSIIPQSPVLFHRTLMENIRYGKIDATDEEVLAASKKAFVHEFVEGIPERYNSMVGERGVKLSGGQLQRIAIARAILKDAPILFLDEATSSLDSMTEALIQSAFDNLMQNKTTLVIAHRLATLLHMDRILVFDKGKIIEDGTHEELLRKKGVYNSLWLNQVGGYLQD